MVKVAYANHFTELHMLCMLVYTPAPVSTHLYWSHTECVSISVDAPMFAHHNISPQITTLNRGFEAAV